MPDLNALLAPKTIAIIGASPNSAIIRGKVQHVLNGRGFPGRIYPVSRSQTEVQGLKAYPTIADIPETVDLAVIIIPAADVPDVLEQCGRAGVKAAFIISSGFAEEPGGRGSTLQEHLREIAHQYDMAVCGPNAEGFFNAPGSIAATFSPAVENFDDPLRPDSDKGRRIGILAQSGGLGFAYFHRGRPRQMRFDYLVSTGNEVALEGSDIAEHLIDTDRADILMMYLEGIRSAETFRRLAGKAAERGKPLIVAKMGASEVGQRAAASHTAALAGSDSTYDAVFRHYGVIRATDMDEQLDIAAAFAFCALPRGGRVAVLSASGGAAVWMADSLSAQGLEIPELDAPTRTEIAKLIPSYGAAANPVDLTAGTIRRTGYAQLVEILQRSPLIDAVVIVGSLANAKSLVDDAEALERAVAHPTKPVLFCAYTRPAAEAVNAAAKIGLPVFSSMRNCARALKALVDYAAFAQRWHRRQAPTPLAEPEVVRRLLQVRHGDLCEFEAKAVLRTCNVPSPREQLAADADAAVAAASEIGWPVALKIQSPDILHKTEVGGIALNLGSTEAVQAAYRDIMASARASNPDAEIRGVLVQQMAEPGHEFIVGIHRDPTFGPMLMVGLGGIYVEILKDVAFAPVPLSRDDALALIDGLKGAPLLKGARGQRPADISALADVLVSVGKLADALSDEIEEIDLNPVLVHSEGRGVSVVDALIVRRK